MGDHDHTVLTGRYTRSHDDDVHHVDYHCDTGSCTIDPDYNTHNDGRTLRRSDTDGYPGAHGAGPPYMQVYRFNQQKLISDLVHAPDKPTFKATHWEWNFAPPPIGNGGVMYSYIRRMTDYIPVIDEGYRVVAHLGWIQGDQIYVPVNSVGRSHPNPGAEANLKKLGLRMQGFGPRLQNNEIDQWEMYHSLLKHNYTEAVNNWVKLGGVAIVGRTNVLNERTMDTCFTSDQRCLVLVKADGQLACVLDVVRVKAPSLLSEFLNLADVALTVWSIIDLVWIGRLALYQLGRLFESKATIRTLQLIGKAEARPLSVAARDLAKREVAGVEREELAAQSAKVIKSGAELDAELERSFKATFTENVPAPHPDALKPTPHAPELQFGFKPAELPAFKRLLGTELTTQHVAVLGRLWRDAANAGESATLTLANSRQLFDNHAVRFWRRVRADPQAKKLFTDAGLTFGTEPGPFRLLPDGRKFKVSIDHIVERQAAPTRALDPSNLRIVTVRENTVTLQKLHAAKSSGPFLNQPQPPPRPVPPRRGEP